MRFCIYKYTTSIFCLIQGLTLLGQVSADQLGSKYRLDHTLNLNKRKIEYYKVRYGSFDLTSKIVDNWGNGFENLYGTRNIRPVLHGIAYRGGANNYFHKKNKRHNNNPLPEDGLSNLCSEGFSTSVYLYTRNWKTAKTKVNCQCDRSGTNKMKYVQLDYHDDKDIYELLKLVRASAISDSVGPVYLHCWNGWHASGLVSALCLRQFCGISGPEAVKYWDLATDGANKNPRYNKIRSKIMNFKPYPELKIDESISGVACAPMPEVVDKRKHKMVLEHMLIVPEAVHVRSKFIMSGIEYDENEYELKSPENIENLEILEKALKNRPDFKVEIGGHTDNVGSSSRNQRLSHKRAKFIVEYLITKGIPEKQLRYKGYGDTKPVSSNKSKRGREDNRRIEVKLLRKKGGSSDRLTDYKKPAKKKVDTVEVLYPFNAGHTFQNIDTIPIGSSFILEGVEFPAYNAILNDSNVGPVNQLLRFMTINPNYKFEIGGYTDISGTWDKNMEISKSRAWVIHNYLQKFGIPFNRLEYKGYGQQKPIFTNSTEEGRAKNRRIEVKILAR